MVILKKGESAYTTVLARKPWNHSGIELQKGNQYKLEVSGDQHWKDWHVEAGPDGFEKWYMKMFEPLRRVSHANWFALIGALGRSKENCFVIGRSISLAPILAGELVCFANDVRGFYFNNSGSIELKVTRLT